MGRIYLFTSESVSAGHPDKVADQISDAVLDWALERDPHARVACEAFVGPRRVLVGGEVRSAAFSEDRVRPLLEALDELGQPADAEPILRDLLTLAPLGESYWHSLALVVAHQGRFDDARQVGREAVETLRAGGRTPDGYDWIDRMEAARGGTSATQIALIN